MIKKEKIIKAVQEEFAYFEKHAGESPVAGDFLHYYKNVGAVWVISGAGSYLRPIIDSPSDNIYKKYKWYSGQDKKRLDYAAKWLAKFNNQYGYSPTLVYNGTVDQDKDLLQAIKEGKIVFPAKIFIPEGKIANTLDQVKNFSFPKGFDPKKMKLAVFSHSAHLPRILRFMGKFPGRFKRVSIIALSINVADKIGQDKMKSSEIENLLCYIENGNASVEPYPFECSFEGVRISKIVSKDTLDVYKLSNQPSVRSASFSQGKINLEDHRKWFKNKLNDNNVIMLKASISGKLAGQVRLDIKDKTALVGISTSEEFRGKGVASKLLQAAIHEARNRKIRTIDALIKSNNHASIGLFEKNGWVYVGDCIEQGVSAKKYIYKINGKSI